MAVHLTVLAGDRPVQKISGIKLHAGLVGQYLQHAPAGWFINFGRLGHLPTAIVEHPVVIVAMPLLQLIVVGIDSCADLGRLAEIERCSFNRGQFSGWNQILIHRCVAAGVDLHNVLQNVAVSLPCEVEV